MDLVKYNFVGSKPLVEICNDFSFSGQFCCVLTGLDGSDDVLVDVECFFHDFPYRKCAEL